MYITIIKETNAVIYLPLSCTQDGWTPLMIASFNGHVDIVRILTEAQAQINIQNEVYTNISYVAHGLQIFVSVSSRPINR